MAGTITRPSKPKTSVGATLQVAMLPADTRDRPLITVKAIAPAAVTLTLSVAAAVGDTKLVLAGRLTAPIPRGTVLTFGSGPGVAVTVQRTIAAAAPGVATTTVYVQPVTGAIPTTDTASYTPAANASGNFVVTTDPLAGPLDAGTVLTLGGTSVTVTHLAHIGSIGFLCKALSAAVTANSTASVVPLVNVNGATNATPSSAPKTTDTANYLSGVGAEMAIVGTNRTVAVSFNEISGDLGGSILKTILFNDAYYDRELYARIVFADGETHEGVAIVTSGDGSSPVQDKRTRNANFQFQGATYVFTPATADEVINTLALNA